MLILVFLISKLQICGMGVFLENCHPFEIKEVALGKLQHSTKQSSFKYLGIARTTKFVSLMMSTKGETSQQS